MVAQKQNRVVALPTARSAQPSNRLAALKQSKQWDQLPRAVQSGYEATENRLSTLVHVMERHGEAVADARSRSLAGILSSAREWQSFIDALGATVNDEERQALVLAKSNELAGLLTSHQSTLDALSALLDADLQEVMTWPRHEWTKRSLEDKLRDLLTFGEAELERRGYPPLSFWQSVLNTLTLGLVADQQLRDYERARLLPQLALPAMDGEEEAIDVDFTPR
jgi:hypothetical protein